MKLTTLSLVLAIGAIFYANVEAAGTTQCYTCFSVGKCENPPIQKCPEGGETYGCLAGKIPALGFSQIVQGCTLPDSIEIRQLCNGVNLMIGGSCEICNTDLCNTI